MRKIPLLIFNFIIIISFALYPSDSTTDSKKNKFIGKPGVEFGEEFHMDTTGNKTIVNLGNSDLYSKTRAKASLTFPIKFYKITPWLQDALELPMTLGSASAPITLNAKNNFYAGLDNTFEIEKAMTIGINFEFRLGSCLGANPVTNKYDGLEIRLSPNVYLSGSYDFGLSWNICQNFELYFFPDLAPNETENFSNKNLQFTDLEGNYNLSFEFIHFTKIDNIKASLYGELYLLARIMNEGYYTKDYFDPGHQIKNLDPAIGMTFDIYGVTPFLLFFTHAFGNSIDNKITGSWVGIKAGIGYTKEWFSINAVYYGMVNSHSTADCTEGANGKWMNHIETCVNFKIGE